MFVHVYVGEEYASSVSYEKFYWQISFIQLCFFLNLSRVYVSFYVSLLFLCIFYVSIVTCLVGVFPEGGSHDRPELLPLKPGVAIMALRAAAEGAEDILVVPLGLNYYQAHKILSRATIQVGTPIVIRNELQQLYEQDRRAAVSQLLDEVEQVRKLRNIVIQPSSPALY